MNHLNQLRPWAALCILLAVMLACVAMVPSTVCAQETPAAPADEAPAAEAPEAPETPAEQPTTETPVTEDPAAETPAAEEPATETPATEEPAVETPADDEVEVEEEEVVVEDTPADSTPDGPADSTLEEEVTEGEEVPAGEETTATTTAEAKAEAAEATDYSSLIMGIIVVALFVVPAIVGNALGKSLGMPDHGWKIALVIGSVALSALAIGSAMTRPNGFKLGPDLGGGVTLIYDLVDPDLVKTKDQELMGDGVETPETKERRGSVSMDKMLAALKQRVDPSGTKEVTIRARGKSIEFILPKAGQAELDDIKKKITELGQLEFRILSDRTREDEYGDIIRVAESMPPGQVVVRVNNNPVARWVPYDKEEFGGIGEVGQYAARDEAAVKRRGVSGDEILVMLDPYDVTGEYLTSASTGVGQEGPEVVFRFNSEGSYRFGKLTGSHEPNPGSYYLGVILDGRLRTAPSIRTRITDVGTISGRMTKAEVDHIAEILDAGSLPAELNKTPVSEDQTGPEIGALTIQQSTRAMIGSLALVLAFIVVYYRFAGVVAAIALILNIALVVATMVLLNAAFTLPGLAGLVLTVGMSVDANVLIFERMREELARGATLRMAIRNGFSRATTTIVDSNVTTLITGVVLYVIGTDQIRGFAITLILGILMSMFTAIFVSRLIFDIAERRGWITKLHMMQMLSKTNIDFMNKWQLTTVLSLVLIAIGLVAVVARKDNLLNIDFTGGTSVTMELKDENAMTIAEVRDILAETELADQNLLVVARDQEGEATTTYKIDTSVQDEVGEDGVPTTDAVETVEGILAESFAGKLKTYSLKSDGVEAFTEGEEGENQHSGFQATLHFGEEGTDQEVYGISHETLLGTVQAVLDDMERTGVSPLVTNPDYVDGSSRRFRTWTVQLSGVDESEARAVIDGVVAQYDGKPVFPLASKIGGRVAGDLRTQALYAIVVSLIGIIGYLWIRFQKISYGLAASIAIVHDVLVTLGAVAMSYYLVQYIPGLAAAMKIDSFQIGLTMVAAFLTIIGYSLNDTIVIFDRIREIRGKSPKVTAGMINTAVNQTLSRTILTSLTTLIVLVVLYFFGGEGIHGFAFAMVVGVLAGVYSTVFIASPLLLWLANREAATSK
jgi:SecD/SecF fusion protein